MITKEMIASACDELALLLIQKNNDYGNSFYEQFQEYGLTSSAIRLEDKLRRLKFLIKNPQMVQGEKMKDTVQDSAGYAIMTWICLNLLEQLEKESR